MAFHPRCFADRATEYQITECRRTRSGMRGEGIDQATADALRGGEQKPNENIVELVQLIESRNLGVARIGLHHDTEARGKILSHSKNSSLSLRKGRKFETVANNHWEVWTRVRDSKGELE